ncbi:MAG TPA: TetR/AcrR family transcriptional regulator [Terriglobales bacterium]|nr:TetR/AcrR family transcriptional regulator [Terriglobales bacterium]
MAKTKKRSYRSLVRQRQAGDTRRRIVEATRQLLQAEGYAGMTIEAIAQRAEVSAQSVYAIFKSKTGILTALLDQSTFGPDYEEVVRQARGASDPETRLRLAARVARQIRGAQSAAFDLMRGAGVVAPELAKLQQQRERLRYEREESMIIFLRDSGRLRPGLSHKSARDISWMLTGGDVYRMLVRERGWSPQKYQDWLADTLVRSLLAPGRPNPGPKPDRQTG